MSVNRKEEESESEVCSELGEGKHVQQQQQQHERKTDIKRNKSRQTEGERWMMVCVEPEIDSCEGDTAG